MDGPRIVKIRRDLGIGSESKIIIFVDVGLERLKVYVAGKRVPVARSHGDKRIGECVLFG